MISFRMRVLERNVASAIGVVTKVVDRLEAHNKKYDELRVELEDKMTETREQHKGVCYAINQNSRVIENFKNLLR